MQTTLRCALATWVILAFSPLQGDCGSRWSTTVSRPVPAPMAARLITGHPAVEVVSPVGIASTLCSLAPVTSEKARLQIVAALGIDCDHFSDYSPAAIWLQRGPAYDTAVLSDLKRHAELFEGDAPFNAAIADWTRRRGGAAVTVASPIKFAAVSVLAYSATWQFPIVPSRIRPGMFHGRQRAATVTFISGIGAFWEHDRKGTCGRASIRLAHGGALRLSKIEGGKVERAVQCAAGLYADSVFEDAFYTIPRVTGHGQSNFTQRLKEVGVRDIFTQSDDPLARLRPALALDAVLQATEFRIDETGVGVRASTFADTELGVPHPKLHLLFDTPFAFEVLGEHEMPVALGTVNDL